LLNKLSAISGQLSARKKNCGGKREKLKDLLASVFLVAFFGQLLIAES
jgi:hypothetical protein